MIHWLALFFTPGTTKGCMTEGLWNISILAESSRLNEWGVSIYTETLRYPDIYDTIFYFSARCFPYSWIRLTKIRIHEHS